MEVPYTVLAGTMQCLERTSALSYGPVPYTNMSEKKKCAYNVMTVVS